jgi:hypothetical protein
VLLCTFIRAPSRMRGLTARSGTHISLAYLSNFVLFFEVEHLAEGKGKKWPNNQQKSRKHAQGTDPTQQHRPTQNTTSQKRATLQNLAKEQPLSQDHKPIVTRKSNNHPSHNPKHARSQMRPAEPPNVHPCQRHKPARQAGRKQERRAKPHHGMGM